MRIPTATLDLPWPRQRDPGSGTPGPGVHPGERQAPSPFERSPNSTLPEPIDGSLKGGTSASGHEAGLWLYPSPIPGTIQEHAPGSRDLRPGERAPGEVAVVEIGVGDGVVRPVEGIRLARHLPWNLRYRVRLLKPPALLIGKAKRGPPVGPNQRLIGRPLVREGAHTADSWLSILAIDRETGSSGL